MLQPRCPYCGSTDGCCTTTSLRSASPSFVKECKSCGRIVEEHHCDVQELFVERAQDTPLCIVTPDFSNNEEYRTPPLEDDPFESIGFITAFSTWSLELSPLYTSTTSSFCGYLAELERVLSDPGCSSSAAPASSNTDTGAAAAVASTGSNSSMVDNLRAYFQILEVSSLLGLDRDISDHALQLFRECSSTSYMRNRNVEALATAALVQASREAKEARTLQEISTAANVSQKEIHRYMKILTDALKLSQPIDSNSISVYMPRFCNILELDKSTQDLATHIGEVVMNKSFCTRRNPISISAAAIYLSCQLEDKRKTQTEICKATALTEVTLRKVYKELLENLADLLPANYTPVVPIEKAFPVSGSSSSRVPIEKVFPISGSNASRVLGTRGVASSSLASCGQPHPDISSSRLKDGSEQVSLFGNNFKSCIRNPPAMSINGKSMVLALPSGMNAADTSSSAGHQSQRQDEDSSAPPNEENSCHPPNLLEQFLSHASHTPVSTQVVSRPVSLGDGHATMSLPFMGMEDRELLKGDVQDRLAQDMLTKQEVVGHTSQGYGILQGAPDGCNKASTSSASPRLAVVEGGFPRGLLDLNSSSTLQDEVLSSKHELGYGGGLRQGMPGESNSGLGRGLLENSGIEEGLLDSSSLERGLLSSAPMSRVKDLLHPSFWGPPPPRTQSWHANEVNLFCEETSDVSRTRHAG